MSRNRPSTTSSRYLPLCKYTFFASFESIRDLIWLSYLVHFCLQILFWPWAEGGAKTRLCSCRYADLEPEKRMRKLKKKFDNLDDGVKDVYEKLSLRD